MIAAIAMYSDNISTVRGHKVCISSTIMPSTLANNCNNVSAKDWYDNTCGFDCIPNNSVMIVAIACWAARKVVLLGSSIAWGFLRAPKNNPHYRSSEGNSDEHTKFCMTVGVNSAICLLNFLTKDCRACTKSSLSTCFKSCKYASSTCGTTGSSFLRTAIGEWHGLSSAGYLTYP